MLGVRRIFVSFGDRREKPGDEFGPPARCVQVERSSRRRRVSVGISEISARGGNGEACHTKIGPPQKQSPRNVRGRKVGPPGTFAAEKSVRWGPSVAPHMIRPCCRWSPVLKAFLRPYLDCRRSVLQFETLLASTDHRALLPALPTSHHCAARLHFYIS